MCKYVPPMNEDDFNAYSNMPKITSLFVIRLSNGQLDLSYGDIRDFNNLNPKRVEDNSTEQKET